MFQNYKYIIYNPLEKHYDATTIFSVFCLTAYMSFEGKIQQQSLRSRKN